MFSSFLSQHPNRWANTTVKPEMDHRMRTLNTWTKEHSTSWTPHKGPAQEGPRWGPRWEPLQEGSRWVPRWGPLQEGPRRGPLQEGPRWWYQWMVPNDDTNGYHRTRDVSASIRRWSLMPWLRKPKESNMEASGRHNQRGYVSASLQTQRVLATSVVFYCWEDGLRWCTIKNWIVKRFHKSI